MNFFKLIFAASFTALLLSLSTSHTAIAKPDSDLFGQLPAAHDGAISPDGTRVAVVRAVDGNYIIQIVSLSGDKSTSQDAIKLTKGSKPKWIHWANNDRILISYWGSMEMVPTQRTGTRFKQSAYYSGHSQSITLSSIFTIDARTLEGNVLIRPQGGFRQYNDDVLNWLQDDDDHILMQFADSKESQLFPDVRKVNVETGRNTVVHSDRDGITDWITTTNGKVIAGTGFTTLRGQTRKTIIRDPASGKFESVDTFEGLDLDTQILSGFPDMERLIVRAYRGQNTLGLHIYNLSTRQYEETIFQDDVYDAGAPIYSRDGTKIVGANYVADAPKRTLLPEYGSVLKEAESKLDGYSVNFIDQSDDAETVLLRVSNPYDPGGLYTYKAGGSFSLLAQNYPGIDPQTLGNVVAVRYTARDGMKIPAYVTLPTKVRDNAQLKNLPFIVLPHGGPYARDYKGFDWLAQLFATHGYGVLQMNFRGSTGFGEAFESAGRSDWTLIQDDVEDGARYLIEKGYADPGRLCIAGWSFGGYASLMGAANDPELYQCAIAIAALTDVQDFYRDRTDFAFGSGQAKQFLGGLLDDGDLRRANNPVDRADDIRVPVLLAHGTLDTAVEHDQFTDMKRALGNRQDLVALSYRDEDHYFTNQDNRQDLAENLVDFARDHLGKSRFAAD